MVKQTKKQEPIQLPEGFDEELEDLGIIALRNSKWTEEKMAYLDEKAQHLDLLEMDLMERFASGAMRKQYASLE